MIPRDEKHLTSATRSLTMTLEGVAWFLSKLDRLDGVINALVQFQGFCGPHEISKAAEHRLHAEFTERVAALRSRMAGYRPHAARMHSQGEAMVQAVRTPYLLSKRLGL